MRILFCLIVCYYATQVCQASESLAKDLLKDYDKNVRPPGDGPVEVKMNIYVLSISSVSEKTMDFTANLYLRQSWQDSRLAHPNITSKGIMMTNKLSQLWLPDTFIRNDRTSNKAKVTTLNAFIRGYPNGTLLYSQRITSTISCPMYLRMYPLDVQHCKMMLASYGFTTQDLRYSWESESAVATNEEIQLPEHVLEPVAQADCSKNYSTGAFSCISAEFVFKRNVNYYIIGLFIPSILIVILSWVSFWIDKDSTPGRVSLALLTILTMQNQMSTALSQLPKVSYIKLVDVWLTGCLVFVFAGFLEFALVNTLAKKEKRAMRKASIANRAHGEKIGKPHMESQDLLENHENNNIYQSDNTEDHKMPKKRKICCCVGKRQYTSDGVDYYARWIFPAAFLLFNVILWIAYFLVA